MRASRSRSRPSSPWFTLATRLRPAAPGRQWRALRLVALAAVVLTACSADSPAPKAAWPGPFTVPPSAIATPVPIVFPRDEAPHDVLTEWWYYTGHLRDADGRQFGFQSVIFQSRRDAFPPFFAAHVAVTDQSSGTFAYDQRTGQATVGTGPGFAFTLGDWSWQGLHGNDRLAASAGRYALSLALTSRKPPVLHNGGFIDFGAAGSTYYYSRTRLAVSGTLVDGGRSVAVTGEAWFDHQWGNFLGNATGGWDWFSAQLDDGSEFTLSILRGAGQVVVGGYGTYVDPRGTSTMIAFASMQVQVLDQWRSPATGVLYPSSWLVALPEQQLRLVLTPVLTNQELDTRASTGNIYWEGAVRIAAAESPAHIVGQGYVELTGYDHP